MCHRIPHPARLLLAILSPALWVAVAAAAEPPYLRYPDLHGNRLVLNTGGDLWITDLEPGATARRLTSHAGDEVYPCFSPDGATIAFSGSYDGNVDVYVVGADGGEPRRLTWHPSPDGVVGWLPDGRVLFRSRREEPHGSFELFAIAASGGDPERLPIGWAARLAADPESGLWAFTRLTRERNTWKRYRGGTNENIWVGHPDRGDFRQITSFDGIDAFPMWHAGRIWFLNDRGGSANLWSMDPTGGDAVRHTQHEEWDVRYPNMSPDGRIVYMLGGDIWLYSPESGDSRKLAVDIPDDRILVRRRYPDPDRFVTSFAVSPDGDRLLLEVRGDLFSVPAKKGVTLPLTSTSGARERGASYDAKGERAVYITDQTGEEAIAIRDAFGRGEPTVVKAAAQSGWHFPPRWSPDARHLAFSDQTQTLYIVPSAGGAATTVDHSEQAEIRDYAWSPDGRWLAYSKLDRRSFSAVYIFDTRDGKRHRITGEATSDAAPEWDPKGRYLYFLGDRTINPLLGERDFEEIDVHTTRPYLLLLRRDVPNPLTPRRGLPGEGDKDEADDENKEGSAGSGKRDKASKAEPTPAPPAPVDIELDGLASRVVELPVDPGKYQSLAANSKRLFFLSVPVHGIADDNDLPRGEIKPERTLLAFTLDEPEKGAVTVAGGIADFRLASNGKKLVTMGKRGVFHVVEADKDGAAGGGKGGSKGGGKGSDDDDSVDLGNVVLEVEPRAEWRQMFQEAWRHMRDFHWEPTLGGLDWQAMRAQYGNLLPRISNRDELGDLIGELIGELATSHTYVWGGDSGVEPHEVTTGLLGAELRREGGYYRVARILRGDPADRVRSPLDEPGSQVAEGEYLLAVNNRPFAAGTSYLAALANLAKHPTLLSVSSRPSLEGARTVVVVPVADDGPLRYADWVRRNREYVGERSHGKYGYVHIPDMGADGLVAFETWFYPQLDKEGLVVDARWNGGGFVSQLVLARLQRRVVSFGRSRGGEQWTYPYRALNGPFVVLADEHAGSDGDIFPKAVQLLGLAPVIGTRTWGGVIGIRADKPLVDGGMLTQPEYASWYPDGGWIVENQGVKPDVEVVNLPQDVARGVDAQLDRGIAELDRLREQHPPLRPAFGPEPIKTRETFRGELK
ncbi:MAG: PD40 domain-containing protein [Candidatus Schekmanbacteria bacterium]|nr:PD40 domain-containing protein [Candidatus Schekmanbacteria bacterium]